MKIHPSGAEKLFHKDRWRDRQTDATRLKIVFFRNFAKASKIDPIINVCDKNDKKSNSGALK